MNRAWPRLLRALLATVLLLLSACSPNTSGAAGGTVEWIYDGDTLRVGGIGKVRLLGIDTPEKGTSSRDDAFLRLGARPQRLRPVGKAALRFNIEQAKGQTVRLVYDRRQKDRHQRTLAYVYLPDGRMLNRVLLEQGYAVVYRRFPFRHKEDFLRAEAAAREAGLGLWGD